jgi:uncharacterized protein
MLQHAKEMALQSRDFWERAPVDKYARHGFQLWKRTHPKRRLHPEDVALIKRIRGDER